MPQTTQDIQAEILDAIRKSQEAVVDAIKRWAETVQSVTSSLPTPNLPYAGKLPKPEEVVDTAYGFAEHLLAVQRDFAQSLLHTVRTQTAPWSQPAPKAGTAKASTSSASTSSARTSGTTKSTSSTRTSGHSAK